MIAVPRGLEVPASTGKADPGELPWQIELFLHISKLLSWQEGLSTHGAREEIKLLECVLTTLLIKDPLSTLVHNVEAACGAYVYTGTAADAGG
jgi:hypothetical protein